MAVADRSPRFVPPAENLSPTAEQRAIQSCTAPTLLVEARAGAAKTTTLALRLAEAWSKGAAPAHCLVLTYTAVACTAFRQTLEAIGVPGDVAQRFRITTFDEFAASVLRESEGTASLPRRLLPEQLRQDVDAAVRQVADATDERWPEDLEYPSPGDAGFVSEFLDNMLWLKGSLRLETEPDDGVSGPDHAADLGQRYMTLRTFAAYERLRAGGHPDRPVFRGPFDATYDLARQLSRDRQDGLDTLPAGWPQRLRVLLVDEMHDMNEAMFAILRQLLAAKGTYFTGVGDADQVIHAAAGADAAFMGGRIEADTGRATTRLPLTTSFRFGPQLAEAAGRFIRKPLESGQVHATQVLVSPYADDADCAAQVLRAIAAWRKANWRKAAGLAVLLRHEHQSITIENALIEADIAYRCTGFESYLSRPEVLLVRGLLAIVTRDFGSLQGRETLSRVVQAFMLFCGTRFDEDPERPEATQAGLMAEALRDIEGNAEVLPLFLENRVLRKAEPGVARRLRAAIQVASDAGNADVFDRFLAALDMPWFIAQALVQPERRADALRNLDGLRRLAAAYPSTAKFFDHLNQTALKRAGMQRQKAITLASAAAVKGLEFEEVLLPFLEQGEFPDRHGRSTDEGNLFYVAVTRARTTLRLYAHIARPSEFLRRSGLGTAPAG